MGYFPLYTDIRDFRILMVGGGAIALRRLKTLQMFHEHITVISPSVCKEIEDMVLEGFVTWISRSYVSGDLKNFDMVLAATDDREVNHTIFLEAGGRKYLSISATAKKSAVFIFLQL